MVQTPDYYGMVEEAWRLSEAARDYVSKAGRDIDSAELWEAVFARSPLVDHERTRRDGDQPIRRIFFNTPYGLHYRADHKDWIPFRHSPLNPAPLQMA